MSTPPSPGARRDVVLHIGSGKTGTSSIQAFLRDNRDRLAEQGRLYPTSSGRAGHLHLGLFVMSESEARQTRAWHEQKQSDHDRFRRAFRRRLLSQIDSSDLPGLLLSDEGLFRLSDPALRRLGRFMGRIADTLRVVVYLRRQDDHMASSYQQAVRIGTTARLVDYARGDRSALYDYHRRLRRHQRFLRPTELVVRRFERDSFVGGSLFQDFLDAAGLDEGAHEWRQVATRNESLDGESLEVLRLLNIYRVEHKQEVPRRIESRMVRRLTEASTGPTLTLPGPVLDAFMAQWEGTNRRVAREFLDDASGELFHLPRKVHNTTSEQYLDPARLDYFIDLLQLPEHMRRPLRALAEQEAKVR